MLIKLIVLSVFLLFLSLSGCETVKEPEEDFSQQSQYRSTQRPIQETGTLTRALPFNLKKGMSSTQATSTNSLGDHWRYTSEDKDWRVMVSQTAYFRDEFAGVETIIQGATDGESWHAEAIRPDGSTITWDPVKFYAVLGSRENCFVSRWWTECYTRDIIILWYTGVRCAPTGTWTMNFYNNGIKFATTTFTLKPQIEAGRVPTGSAYNQGTYATQDYDNVCVGSGGKSVPCGGDFTVPQKIKNKGCYLTGAAMILNYHGVNVTPDALNTWLINNNGYFNDDKGNATGNVDPASVARYARSRGVDVTYIGKGVSQDGILKNMLCALGPQLIGVKLDANGTPAHWVVATGYDDDRKTWIINDPNGGGTATLADKYNDKWGQIRQFAGPSHTYLDKTRVWIVFRSPGELLLNDPQGHRIGYDPLKGIRYQEIPNSWYETSGLADDTDPNADPDLSKEIEVMQPLEGDYQLVVTGTGTGTYTLGIRTTDPSLNPSTQMFSGITIVPGNVHTYAFSFSKSVGFQLKISGGFDGGGQRPKDVNKFLSYANPSESQTTPPAGTTTFPLHIFYGATIIPGTFKAELNGANIASLFNPVPGENEIVALNLASGRNVLLLSVDGNLPTRVATDTDRLVFKVQ